MESVVIFKVIISLLFVVVLMYCTLRIIQKYSKIGKLSNLTNGGIKIESVLYVDENAKVVNLRQSKMNYILAIGKNNIVLIDKYADIDQSK